MSHIEDARNSVQKVVSLLVTRFGSQEEVFGHLTDVLRHIGEAEAEFARMTKQPEAVAAVEVAEAESPAVVESAEELVATATIMPDSPPVDVTGVIGRRLVAEPEEAEPDAPKPKRPARRKRGNA